MEDKILTARITSEHKGLYTAQSNGVYYSCKIKGKHLYEASSREDFPAVGDLVNISIVSEGQGIIEEILERKTILRKKDSKIIATNVDIAFIVEAPDRDYSLNRFERYIILARDGGITPVLILNKIDTITKDEVQKIKDEIQNRFPDIDVILTNTQTQEGYKELHDYIEKGKIYCFLGSSGVGKSSLTNMLLDKKEIQTQEISIASGRGKHTTTRREMFSLDNGGLLIDTPGIREVGTESINVEENETFDELNQLAKKCKYSDCTHTHEPGCALLKELKDEQVDEEQYENYIRLQKENEHYESTQIERKDKDRKFGKFIKNSNKDLKKIKGWE